MATILAANDNHSTPSALTFCVPRFPSFVSSTYPLPLLPPLAVNFLIKSVNAQRELPHFSRRHLHSTWFYRKLLYYKALLIMRPAKEMYSGGNSKRTKLKNCYHFYIIFIYFLFKFILVLVILPHCLVTSVLSVALTVPTTVKPPLRAAFCRRLLSTCHFVRPSNRPTNPLPVVVRE